MDLKDIFLFQNLEPTQIDNLKQISRFQNHQKGNFLFFAGDQSTKLYILIEGVLKIFKNDDKGNEVVIHYFSPIKPIAELANLEHRPFPASAQFETDGKVLAIDFIKFEERFLKAPEVAMMFIKSLTKKLLSLEEFIDRSLVLDATSRIARFIWENEDIFLKEKNIKLSSILGVTPETFSRALRKFKDDGLLVDKKNKILKNKEVLLDYGN